ncbi:MAG: proton-conducting transporter membrane subunit [Patescibacteria group bacterium]
MILLLFGVCLVSALLPLVMHSERALFRSAISMSTILFASTVVLAVPALSAQPFVSPNGWLYIDSFAALLILIVGFIQWTATLVSIQYFSRELRDGHLPLIAVRVYYGLVSVFALCMFVVLTSNNLGLMWVALEGTTLATTLLVGLNGDRGGLRAAWKYLILCSVGISLGLLGVFFVVSAGVATGLAELALSFTSLHGAGLSPELLRLAFIFILIGYGTKVGLVPMHAWLPDAHSHAPSPMSALLSGVLLNVALFAILRYKMLVDGALGSSDWSNTLMITLGTLSFVVPAGFILVQKNYKRLLAYSSIEHMGFATVAFGLGTPGMVYGVIHLIGHSLTKSMLFFGAGNILLHFKDTSLEKVRGVMTALPYSGSFFLAGIVLLLAVPPSPLFMSEFGVIAEMFRTYPWYLGVILLAAVIIGAGFIRTLIPFLFSEPNTPRADTERWGLSHSVMALHLALVVLFGASLWYPGTMQFIQHIVSSSMSL